MSGSMPNTQPEPKKNGIVYGYRARVLGAQGKLWNMQFYVPVMPGFYYNGSAEGHEYPFL